MKTVNNSIITMLIISCDFTAKNKRDAKKITAKAALQALYGLTYEDDIKVDHSDDIQMC